MALSGRPLLDNSVDAEMFVGRDEELRRIGLAMRSGWNALLTGEAGSGKTSLLNQVALRARSGQWPDKHTYGVLYVQAGSVGDVHALLERVTSELVPDWPRGLGEMGREPAPLATLQSSFPREAGSKVRRVVIVDDVAGPMGHDLFGRLRDQLWELDLTWLVSTRDPGALTTPPADAFFDMRIDLGGLSPAETVLMLGKRLGGRHTGAWSRQVSAAVDGNPRRVLDLARQVVDRNDGSLGPIEPLIESYAARQVAIADVGRSAAMLAAELDKRGSAAASDPDLLAALGWTRPRAVQVFNDLESRGLVLSDQVRGERGRPRKVYRLVPAHEYTGKVDVAS